VGGGLGVGVAARRQQQGHFTAATTVAAAAATATKNATCEIIVSLVVGRPRP